MAPAVKSRKVGRDEGRLDKMPFRRRGLGDEGRSVAGFRTEGKVEGEGWFAERSGIRGEERSPYRKRNGGHFSRRGRPFPVHDHREIQTKMADLGMEDEGRDGERRGTGEIRSERGKWERRKSSAERQRGPRGGKKEDDRLDDTRPWCCRPSEFFLSTAFLGFFPSHPRFHVRVLHV